MLIYYKQFITEYQRKTTKWAYVIWNSWCKARNIEDELARMSAIRMDEL